MNTRERFLARSGTRRDQEISLEKPPSAWRVGRPPFNTT
jgi:hypothetical protein